MTLLAAEAGVSTPLWVTLIVGLAGAAATASVAVAGRIAQERNRRRDLYSQAVRAVIAWTEYPYEVRRRTSNDRQVLDDLAAIGHQLQQDLAYFHAWLGTDKPALGRLYAEVVANVKRQCQDALEDAWAAEPIDNPTGMILGEWGPGSCSHDIERLRHAIASRFGWRRFLTTVRRVQ